MNRNLVLTAVLVVSSAALSACATRAYAVRVPPPPVVGVVGFAPGPGYAWTDGFWDLLGSRWYWAPGRWVVPPRPRAVWVPGYWAPGPRNYRWRAGYWR